MEYREDLKQFWTSGPPYEINGRVACFTLKDIHQSFHQAVHQQSTGFGLTYNIILFTFPATDNGFAVPEAGTCHCGKSVCFYQGKVNRIKLHWLAYMATRWTWRRHWKSHTLLLTLRHGPENLNCPRTVQRRFEMRQFSGTTYSMTVQNLRFLLRKTKSRMKYFFVKRKEREIVLGKNHSSFVY